MSTRSATAAEVRNYYTSKGFAARIREGRITYRCEGGPWMEGRWVSEYRVDENGQIFLA